MSVLVTHAHNRLAYYATRCLAKHGIKVTCASEFPLAATFFSRYCTDHFTYPSPWSQTDQFIEKIIEEIEKRNVRVLMPVHREGYLLAQHKETIDQLVEFPYPTSSQIYAVNNKAELVKIGREAKVAIPKTIIPNSPKDLEEAKTRLDFPVVIKLRQGYGRIGQSIVEDPSKLTETYMETTKKFKLSREEYPIIQEFISGKKMYIGMLFNQGELIAKFSHHTIRQYTAASYRIEYEDPRVTSALGKLAKHLGWHGIISGDFIVESKTDTPYLTDINPRFWGSLYLAILSGVEFPHLLYGIAVEKNIQPVLEYSRGLKAKWFMGELACLARYTVAGDIRQVFSILTCHAPIDSWDWSDLTPFFALPLYPLAQFIRTGTLIPLGKY
jgi:predicted ATP-grasp superfamily ATP-dependent carboligase